MILVYTIIYCHLFAREYVHAFMLTFALEPKIAKLPRHLIPIQWSQGRCTFQMRQRQAQQNNGRKRWFLLFIIIFFYSAKTHNSQRKSLVRTYVCLYVCKIVCMSCPFKCNNCCKHNKFMQFNALNLFTHNPLTPLSVCSMLTYSNNNNVQNNNSRQWIATWKPLVGGKSL
ncbi:unnamed protein product [Ceratitis capitata]|uniref:(Mediterranean fruit fly) hypothetical protein n=1 Tax=Ceratitis capitata TaxID=7213 RepID=A0A811TYW2_CERCA|nr:unnamed protein product [Ceratitis capitata]